MTEQPKKRKLTSEEVKKIKEEARAEAKRAEELGLDEDPEVLEAWDKAHPDPENDEVFRDKETEETQPQTEEQTQKKRILDKIEAQVDNEEKSEFLKWLKKYEVFHPYIKTLVECLSSFAKPKYKEVGKILLVMVRNGDKIDTHIEVFNLDGSETMFDENGDVVEIMKSDKP